MLARARSLAAVGLLLASQAHAGAVFDLRTDFSNAANPNGPWSYNEGANPLPFISDWIADPGILQPAWARFPTGVPGHIPCWFAAAFVAEDWLLGDVISHCWDPASGQGNSFSNVTWTAPTCGTAKITGHFWLARNIGRSVQVSLIANGQTLSQATVFDGDPYSRANPRTFAASAGNPAALNAVPVKAGDQIMVRLDNVTASGEFVGLELTIELGLLGDLDADLDVDSTDLNILLSDFACSSSCVGDADGDGDVDSTDLNIVLSSFGLDCG